MSEPRATGRCICGAVRYQVRGPLRDVLICHFVECTRGAGDWDELPEDGLPRDPSRDEIEIRWS